MASEIKVNKITGKGATGGADAPLQFSDNSISKMNLSGTAPLSPVAGDMYYDTTDNTLQIYNGTAWLVVKASLPAAGSGGTETTYSTYKVHTFIANGTFTVTGSTLTCDILVVGGGGQGGYGYGGGGGSGGIVWNTGVALSVGNYPTVIGAGGTGHRDSTVQSSHHGESSTFNSITAGYGGGGGSDSEDDGIVGVTSTSSGMTYSTDGGKGGQGGRSSGGTYIGGDGGYFNGTTSQNTGSTGGGATGGAGWNGSYIFASDTRALLDAASIGEADGNNRYIAGTGGGSPAWSQTGGFTAGGLGGGGASSGNMDSGAGGSPAASSALANTGGGGGGQSYGSYDSGAGGSGVVIIRYAI